MSALEDVFESTPCPLCGGKDNGILLIAPDRFNLRQGPYLSIVQCKKCQFIFLNPRPTPATIAGFYTNSGYQPFLSTQSSRSLWDRIYAIVRRWAVRNKRRKIEKLKPAASLLDVGCGTGEFLREMRSHGWQVSGIEKEVGAARFASEKYGLTVSTDDPNQCRFETGSFDVITFWHVLEHLFDPVAVLRQCGHWLNEDGIILVAAPNMSSLDAAFYKENWVALDSPRHLVHLTPVSMAGLCRATGLEMLGHHQMLLDVFYNCLLSEKLILESNQRNLLWGLPGFVRALFVACRSAVTASGFGSDRLGSSILYIIKKRCGRV